MGIIKLYSNYDLLSIGAVIQNMLLAIHEKGYGACWMNEPAIAGVEINRILGVSPEERFISLAGFNQRFNPSIPRIPHHS